ncbi:hypothetical protein RVBP17_1810 [Pseudomonas phage sp. 30-3]|nr:hypothetical protein GBBBJNDB_00112 [Pseudomonas phage Callisto]WPK38745.1 hypothetical protein Cassandra_0069 [Pseudomonas phage Cassandra]WPK39266.1 hypothetical protein Deiofobo_0069 [Pseudomonas phage Deifobo]WPK39778.1 hypothetical protein ETTORE_0069 [Pseudomonas phage Ettore]WPK40299.1 hypothetical protein Paride_0069 [Pseudomonas phage Paride]BDR25776.1 hypothetical protein RVBP16_2160 [Pseudomonas phage sp. 30-2]BDR26138.1 hypothetical protein RVBP17_1810 [Pseudomonas phage sp. 30
MINIVMKIKEIILENKTHIELYGAANTDIDAFYNPELYTNNQKQIKRYAVLGMTGDGPTPVFKTIPKNPANKPFNNHPKNDDTQSPGFRGLQMAKERAGLPFEPYQKIDPSYKQYNDIPYGPGNIMDR